MRKVEWYAVGISLLLLLYRTASSQLRMPPFRPELLTDCHSLVFADACVRRRPAALEAVRPHFAQ